MDSTVERRLSRAISVLAAAAVFVLGTVAVVPAQSVKSETVALVPVVPLRAAGPDSAASTATDPLAQYTPVVTESLRIGLVNSGFTVARAAPSTNYNALWKEAADLDAKLLVYGTCSVAQGRLVIQLSAYDTNTKQLVTGSLATGNIDLSLYNVIDSVTADLVSKVRAWAAANLAKEYASETKLLRKLTLTSSDEGAEVLLPGGAQIGTVKDGKLVTDQLQIPLGSTIALQVKKRGYLDQLTTVKVTGTDETARIEPMWTHTYFSLGVLWTTGFAAGGGVDMRFFLVPDWVYLGYDAYVSTQPPALSSGSTLIHADNSLSLGFYVLQGPRRFVRLSMSYGLGVINTFLPDSAGSQLVDFYVSFVNPTIDFTFRRMFLYLRMNLRFVLDTSGAFLRTGVMGTPDLPPFTAGLGFKW